MSKLVTHMRLLEPVHLLSPPCIQAIGHEMPILQN